MIKFFSIFAVMFLFTFNALAEVGNDFCVLYAKMPKVYVRKISVKEIAEKVLFNLNVLDKKVRVGGKGGVITLYYAKKSWNFNKPTDENDVEAWCNISKQIIAKAGEFSERFYFADFELTEKVFNKVLPLFDKDSKYFGDGLNVANKRLKNKRLFASRYNDENELYIKIGIFNNTTIENLQKTVTEYSKPNKIVIDLRGNPGGSLETAILAADLFLDGGIIVSTRDNKGGKEIYYNADDNEIFTGVDIQIWVDEQTASAAEMFYLALVEQGRAEVKGGETYGKRTLQNLIELPSGGVVAVTEAYFRSPAEL